MNTTYWKLYAYLSLPISLILGSVIIYNIFIADDINNFFLISSTVLVLINVILSIRIVRKGIK
jgi:hypothetical protein